MTTTARQPVDEFTRTWQSPPGIRGLFTGVQNNAVGPRFISATFGFFLFGGLLALLMRTQLAVPQNTFLDPETYNQFFTVHGTTMMFLFAVPIFEAIATFVLPAMLGTRDLPFPRLTAFGFWAFLFGSLLFFSSFLFGAAPDGGWYAYVPLTGPVFSPGRNMDFWLLGLAAAEIAGLAAAIELIVAVLKTRGIGMGIQRMPVFAWTVLVVGFMILVAFIPVLVGTTLLELDRKIGTRFFDPAAGGNAILWQHLFWIFGHPEVYIQFLPATGIVSMIVPTFARRSLAAYPWIVVALVATAFISFGLWVHHMFTIGVPFLGAAFFAAASFAIAIPSGIQIFAWLATLWRGFPLLQVPLLFVLGFIVNFVLGGLTGVMVATVPFDWQVHDTYFVVAHFHYVLIGGVVFPILGAGHYWLPKITGRLLDEGFGKVSFWLVFVGFNLAFFPMHLSGFFGMPRRYYTYPAGIGLETPNLLSTVGAYVLGIGITVFTLNVLRSLRWGPPAGGNPWEAGTLEWHGPSPPPNYNFRVLPIAATRYPLWEQERLDQGPDETENLARGMAESPSHYRALLSTAVLDGRPQAVIRISSESALPIALAAAVTLTSVGALFDLLWLIVVSGLATVAILVAWHWPNREERDLARSPQEPTLHGLPIFTNDSTAPAWWGMVLFLAALAITLATLAFSYFYLRAGVAVWPPLGVERPPLALPAVGIVILLGAGAGVAWAHSAIRRGDRTRVTIGLVASLVLGALFLGIQTFDYLQLNLAPQHHVYDSLFATISGFHALLVLVGLGMSLVVLIWTLLGYVSPRRRLAINLTSMFWWYLALNWIVVFIVLYASPHLL